MISYAVASVLWEMIEASHHLAGRLGDGWWMLINYGSNVGYVLYISTQHIRHYTNTRGTVTLSQV